MGHRFFPSSLSRAAPLPPDPGRDSLHSLAQPWAGGQVHKGQGSGAEMEQHQDLCPRRLCGYVEEGSGG